MPADYNHPSPPLHYQPSLTLRIPREVFKKVNTQGGSTITQELPTFWERLLDDPLFGE